jgi:hypothetical protein
VKRFTTCWDLVIIGILDQDHQDEDDHTTKRASVGVYLCLPWNLNYLACRELFFFRDQFSAINSIIINYPRITYTFLEFCIMICGDTHDFSKIFIKSYIFFNVRWIIIDFTGRLRANSWICSVFLAWRSLKRQLLRTGFKILIEILMFYELLCHFDLPRFYKFLKTIIIYKFYQQSALLLLVLIPHRRGGWGLHSRLVCVIYIWRDG